MCCLTAPSPVVNGLYFPGFSAKDANPDLGDSSITETLGIGGFAMAAAPAIVRFVGGSAQVRAKRLRFACWHRFHCILFASLQDAFMHTRKMYEICLTSNNNFA
jgi:hypothetical protein